MANFILSAFADEACTALDGQIKALKENGIKYIEPRIIDGKGVITLTDDELRQVREKLDRAGIRVGSLGSPIGKFSIEDDFDGQLALFDRALCACEILGTKRMRIFSFYLNRDEMDKHRDEIIRRLSVMVEIAKKRGITLCHENEAKIYGQMPEDVEDLLSSVNGIRGIFDAANYCVVGGDPVKGIDVTLPYLEYLHIKDALMAGTPGTENGMVIVPAGKGHGHIGEALDKVNAKIDGDVMLTLEPHLYSANSLKDVESRTIGGVVSYKDERTAFDAGAAALKQLLSDFGYEERNGRYIKK
ncbi:MAG: sugar phosphate isomerase/epimerase [Clostridia bacterium]|nr:sugar phosphate isomerase/epimerase [Clostridia bacterium]